MRFDYYSILYSRFKHEQFLYKEARLEIIDRTGSFNADELYRLTRWGILKLAFGSDHIFLQVPPFDDFIPLKMGGL